MTRRLKAPFPWFGGKSRVADLVWERFGDVPNYVEPFFGSGAVLLARPTAPRIETINDLDCYVANFWRAVQHDPELVARHADWPVNEADLHARHLWLVNQGQFRKAMRRNPNYYNARIAGWWVWGISCWIGSGWCSKPEWSGRINAAHKNNRGVNAFNEFRRPGSKAEGVHTNRQKRPNLHVGGGVNNGVTHTEQKRPRITGFSGTGVHSKHCDGEVRNPRLAGLNIWQKRPALHRSSRGVGRQLKQQIPDLGGDSGAAGRGVHASARSIALVDWMQALAERLRSVRVCCGDWTRILGRSPTECIGISGIFLDPPYNAVRDAGIYAHDDMLLSSAVRRYAIANGSNPKLRIALCGYEGEHKMPKNWTCLEWKANGGHGNAGKSGRGRANAELERIWFSPHCLKPRTHHDMELFA